MSRLRERKDKKCLNCGQILHGRYCHQCGQENIETAESSWSLLSHYFKDITHFDGKFFVTIRALFRKPGLLPLEYMKGHRAGYLNPVRMYVFTSALFFLVFFSFTQTERLVSSEINGVSTKELDKIKDSDLPFYAKKITGNENLSREEVIHYIDSVNGRLITFSLGSDNYKSKEEYDSALATGTVRDGFFTRWITYKFIELNNKYSHNAKGFSKDFSNKFIHSFPQMLFLSLPLFALGLKLLYWRRKQFYYVHHIIFSTYLYIWFFVAMLIILLLGTLKDSTAWTWLDIPMISILLYIFYYEYRSMLNFYQQKWGKTFWKFVLLNLIHLVTMIFLLIIFILISLFKI